MRSSSASRRSACSHSSSDKFVSSGCSLARERRSSKNMREGKCSSVNRMNVGNVTEDMQWSSYHSGFRRFTRIACVIQFLPKTHEKDRDMLPATDAEIEHIKDYMQTEAPDLTVTFLQKVYSENVLNVAHDVWDVHTNVDRWWVITEPTNLYAQAQFPNMDLALTFHVGL